MKKTAVKLAFATLILLSVPYFSCATVYTLPDNGKRLLGENSIITVPVNNTLPLEYYASRYDTGLGNILEANPGTDPWLPASGSQIIIPGKLILPDVAREGIVINNAEMRLYYFPAHSHTVVVLPVGIGEVGRETPLNWSTYVKGKRALPTWTPTPGERKDYARKGVSLPAVFPSGPDNPMGLYALYVGKLFAIHGTNADFGVGLRVSHGCIRLRDDDIHYLYDSVPVGTPVRFINEPVKVASDNTGEVYLEAHAPLSRNEAEFNSFHPVRLHLSRKQQHFIEMAGGKAEAVSRVLDKHTGMPVRVDY